MLASTSARSLSSGLRNHPSSKCVLLGKEKFRCIHVKTRRPSRLNATLDQAAATVRLPRNFQWRAASSAAASQGKNAPDPRLEQELLQFRYDLSNGKSAAVRLYEDYLGKLLITSQDAVQLLSQLHKSVWSEGLLARHNAEGADNLRKLLDHYYSGRLPPSPGATATLLSICRDRQAFDAGIELWIWAESQGASFVSISTFAAAIDLYDAAGQSPRACEDLFERAVKEQSLGFDSYLMAPNSILSVPESKIFSSSVSNSLLESIAGVRLRRHNPIQGYLAIDSSLKLRPDGVRSHVSRLILETRPLEEALRSFRLICLGGSKIAEGSIVEFVRKLRATQGEDLRAPIDRFHHVFLASIAQINLLHIAVATGQPLSEHLSGLILLGMFHNLPRVVDLPDKETEDRFNVLAKSLKDTTLRMLKLAGVSTVLPQERMLVIAAQSRNLELFKSALEEAQVQDVPFNRNRAAVALGAALRLEDAEILNQTTVMLGWPSSNTLGRKQIISALVSCAQSVAELDLCRAFYLQAVSDGSVDSDEQIVMKIDGRKKSVSKHRNVTVKSAAALKRQENRIVELMEKMNHVTDLMESKFIRDIVRNPLPRLTLQDGLGKAEESWQRDLYKEMHLDPLSRQEQYQKRSVNQQASQPGDTAKDVNARSEALLPTGLEYAETRFQLFSGMNEIMLLAWASKQKPGGKNRSRKTQTEHLESLRASSLLKFDSAHIWGQRVRSIRGVNNN